jgi:hypothetical protein
MQVYTEKNITATDLQKTELLHITRCSFGMNCKTWNMERFLYNMKSDGDDIGKV